MVASGKKRARKLKFYHKDFPADGSRRVEVIGATGTVWWRMYEPYPDIIKSSDGTFALGWHQETNKEGNIITCPHYQNTKEPNKYAD